MENEKNNKLESEVLDVEVLDDDIGLSKTPIVEQNEETPVVGELKEDSIVEEESKKIEEKKKEQVEIKLEEPKIDKIEADNSEASNEEKKKNNKGLLVAVIVLFLIGVAVCVYSILTQPKEQTKKPIKNKTKEVFSPYRISDNGLTDFDLYFLQLENQSKNKVYSPLSIKYALAMLAEGANGESKKQINDIIGEYKATKYPNNEHMSFANAMFIQDEFKDQVKENYTKSLKDKYNAEVITDSFKTPDTINNWVSNKTFKLVDKLIDDASKNKFFLVNALAIDMNWNYQIHCATGSKDRVPCYKSDYPLTYYHEKLNDNETVAYSVNDYPYSSESEFYHLKFDGKEKTKAANILADYNRYDIIKELGEENIRKTVGDEYRKWLETDDGKNWVSLGYGEADVNKFLDSYINDLKSNYNKAANSTDFMLYSDDNVMAFAKDLKEYDGKILQYVGIMPKKEELSDFVKNTNAKNINKIIGDLKELKIENFKEGVATVIRGDIPLFKYEYELNLLDSLNKLGIKDVFDQTKADLSNMVDNKDIYIDKAVHKANIEFSNEGIKAAAATVDGGLGATSGGFEYLYKIPVEKIDLTFNKPYMYLIRDKKTGEVWFTGTVYEPIK